MPKVWKKLCAVIQGPLISLPKGPAEWCGNKKCLYFSDTVAPSTNLKALYLPWIINEEKTSTLFDSAEI